MYSTQATLSIQQANHVDMTSIPRGLNVNTKMLNRRCFNVLCMWTLDVELKLNRRCFNVVCLLCTVYLRGESGIRNLHRRLNIIYTVNIFASGYMSTIHNCMYCYYCRIVMSSRSKYRLITFIQINTTTLELFYSSNIR